MRTLIKYINPVSLIRDRVFYLLLLLGFCVIGRSQSFRFTPELEQAYDKITHLKFEEGQAMINSIKQSDPDNYLVYHIENYIDFFHCFIDEEEEYFDRIKGNKNIRIDKIQQGPKDSPYYRFSQAEILLQWALVRLKFEEYTTALFEMNKAISLLEENVEEFPDFIENKKSLSALHAMVGTIPGKYRSMLSWVSSFSGTIEQGYQEINEVYALMDQDNFHFKDEVLVIKALIELHLVNDKEAAYKTISVKEIEYESSPLLSFIVANITHKTGRNDEAIGVLEAFRPEVNQHPLYYLDYLHGIYKLNRLDEDADLYIRKYLNYFNGNNYIKEAYQKLAWYEWAIHQDSIEYKRNMVYCKNRGKALIDEDKQALSLAKSQVLPDKELLKARLLNDGGYEVEALQLLDKIEETPRSLPQQIEYYYRRARIAQGLGRLMEAKNAFEHCLTFPFDATQYYQAAASLYLGQVYEEMEDVVKAKYYFDYCLELEPEQYKSSLHQKAKAGLNRLKR